MPRPGIGNPGNKGGGRGSYADDEEAKKLVKWMYGRINEKIQGQDYKWLDSFIMKHGSRLIPENIVDKINTGSKTPIPLDDMTRGNK